MTDDLSNADTMALCARLGIPTKVVTDAFGQTLVLIDRAGVRKLADHAPIGAPAAHAFADQMFAAADAAMKNPPTEGTNP